MKKQYILLLSFAVITIVLISFKNNNNSSAYLTNYIQELDDFKNEQLILIQFVEKSNLNSTEDIEKIREQINLIRNNLKGGLDFWFRYIEPLEHKKINGPLPVEWETEVFEKFEKPYKREGAGLTLAALYLDEPDIEKDSLLNLLKSSFRSTRAFAADSVTGELKTYHHFFLCNRLFLLNLAAIYTTGFECPDTSRVIPELRLMLAGTHHMYTLFNESFPNTALPSDYIDLFSTTIKFVNAQPDNYSQFDHFTFIKEYVNPLFVFNQRLINQYRVVTKNLIDYSLTKNSVSIFNKTVYNGQNPKGIFLRVNDQDVLSEIDRIGKLLFYDPILSGNDQRSCISCHDPKQYFTDTIRTTSLEYNHLNFLPRNTPSLINAEYNHLLMADGQHISLQNQTKAVITNPTELGSSEKEVVRKVLSCNEYDKAFKKFLQYTPQEKEVTFDHIASAITFYYSRFSHYYSPFDEAMNEKKDIDTAAKQGFNTFMSKAQCATCHFVPQFNGVKPPFIGSEFEVLGVPEDSVFKKLSDDKGRFDVNPAAQTLHAFRTGSIRNAERTKPYMHNGVFTTLSQVIDFYDAGGGAGKGFTISNQTLSSDSLRLTKTEKNNLIAFIKSLNENIHFENPPEKLPVSKIKNLNSRKVGGEY